MGADLVPGRLPGLQSLRLPLGLDLRLLLAEEMHDLRPELPHQQDDAKNEAGDPGVVPVVYAAEAGADEEDAEDDAQIGARFAPGLFCGVKTLREPDAAVCPRQLLQI